MNNFTKEELNSRISNRIHAHYVDNLSHYPAEICNASEMVLAWYLDNLSYDEVKKFYNAERIDLYDFCDAIVYAIIQMSRGKISWNKNKVDAISDNYVKCDGILIQLHNKFLSSKTIECIEYALSCYQPVSFGFGAFSRK